MQTKRFYIIVCLFIIAFVWLATVNILALKNAPELLPLFLKHLFPLWHSTLIIGFGFGLPLIVIAGILGWGQLVLLMSKQIAPHLGEAGLFKAITTLFGKF